MKSEPELLQPRLFISVLVEPDVLMSISICQSASGSSPLGSESTSTTSLFGKVNTQIPASHF